MKGWLNSDAYPESGDLVFLDATKPFPFEDRTFDYIFSEHQIEHLTYENGMFMLRECYRVLKPGGTFRVVTPDLDVLFSLHVPQKNDLQQKYIHWIVDKYLPGIGIYSDPFVINCIFYEWGHQFIYDRDTLQNNLKEIGFIDIARHMAGESDDANLRGIESHGKVTGGEEMNRFISMVLESKRPI